MVVDRVRWIILLPNIIGLLPAYLGIVPAQGTKNCFPPESICREPFWVLKRLRFESCVWPAGEELFHAPASQFCADKGAHLIQVEKTDSRDLKLMGTLLDKYHSRGFWVQALFGGSAVKTSDPALCHAFTSSRQIQEKPCGTLALEVMCEKDAVLRDPKQPHVTLERSKGKGTQLYNGTKVTVSCNVKRAQPVTLTLAYGSLNNTVNPEPAEVETVTSDQYSSSNEKCGVVTKATLTQKMDARLDRVHFYCSVGGSGQSCLPGVTTDECTSEGPFQIVSAPLKPELTLHTSLPPDVVFSGKPLTAECHTHVDVGSRVEWAVVVNNHLTHVHMADRAVN
ncbi:hypothetical protein EGW08_007709, partial [Elysia chlorotica]